MIIYYQYGNYIKRRRNPHTKNWEAWQLTYPTQQATHGRCIATTRISSHLIRKVAQHLERTQTENHGTTD